MMKAQLRVATLLAGAALMLGAGPASADPTQHFETFEITCGEDVLVIPAKPGSSTVVTVNGEPSAAVTILMGVTVTVDAVIVFEFHKPFTEHQDVTMCTENIPGGVVVVELELLLTPRSP